MGAFTEAHGWVQGALPLAMEYAGSGQDEPALQEKIAEFLAHGVTCVWVVRLVEPRRVEVHERGKAMRNVLPGESLTAPALRTRLWADGSERIGDLVLDLTPDALASWLASPEAR